ncbi:hypothetical protein FSARC_2455 [Fusarium sarcochroum]|uniref:Uncharacterized protein n=1 Tax=Fusarium sarcochroum TaxID=1208366 RepID=A0A8H4XDT7_9HYPO|nr:hypothetical protein FSARC_2455 [Fusarium sarcochroum]
MAAKSHSFQASYQPLPEEDPSTAALLAPSEGENGEDGRPPVVRLTFSPVILTRIVAIPIIFTDIIFICQPEEFQIVAAIFGIGGILMALWNIFHVFKSFFPGKEGNKFDIKIGRFFCAIGTTSLASQIKPRALSSHIISLIDVCFGLLFIGPSVLSLDSSIWGEGNYARTTWENVAGLSPTIVFLQFVIGFFNLFSLFRKMKIVVYKAEEEEKEEDEEVRVGTITEPYRDEVSEPAV